MNVRAWERSLVGGLIGFYDTPVLKLHLPVSVEWLLMPVQ
jgi:hypothetical protein